MISLPWTKLQDFYLRLGFLKILVAALSPERRSIYSDALLRRVETPALLAAKSVPSLWSRIERVITWYDNDHLGGRKLDQPSISEGQLVAGDHASFLYGITRKSAIKIIDWGRDVGLTGAGHQITERGLIFRAHVPVEMSDRFFEGDVEAWNPFQLDLSEKILFLYHLSEIDHVTLELAADVAGWTEDKPMEAADAENLLCKAMIRMLSLAEKTVRPVEMPAYRVAFDLARTISMELGLQSELKNSGFGAPQSSVPRLPPGKRKLGVRADGAAARVGHKSADHQTIPRVEQLVDLGFLEKPLIKDSLALREARRRWRYSPTEVARRWRTARGLSPVPNQQFLRDGFARAVVFAYQNSELPAHRTEDVALIGQYFWLAYERVGRRHGNSPLDSIALEAMVSAAVEGRAIEMADFERFMVVIKKLNALPDNAFFAGGNDLDTMFIRLKPKFLASLGARSRDVQTAYVEALTK